MIDRNGAKCSELRPMLKAIDSGFDIVFDYATEDYLITHNDAHFQTVKYGEFDRELFEQIRKVVWINVNGDILDHVEEQNAKAEAAEERKMTNMTESLALDLHKGITENYYYGG